MNYKGETELLANDWDLPAIEVPTERAPEKALREWLLEYDDMVMAQMGNVPSAEALHERADMYQEAGQSAWLVGVNRDNARLIEEDPRLYIAHGFVGSALHNGRQDATAYMAHTSYVDAVRAAVTRKRNAEREAHDGANDALQRPAIGA